MYQWSWKQIVEITVSKIRSRKKKKWREKNTHTHNGEKWTEPKRPIGWHPEEWYMHFENKKGKKNRFEEIMAKSLLIWRMMSIYK